MADPISPQDIGLAKAKVVPEKVIDVWNAIIAKAFTAGGARILQNDVVEKLIEELACPRHRVFDEGWLNIEEVYEAAGWNVEYDKPHYSENYSAVFIFTPKG